MSKVILAYGKYGYFSFLMYFICSKLVYFSPSKIIFHRPHFHFLFKSLWKNSLRPPSNCSHPLSGLTSGSFRLAFSGRLSTPVFCRQQLNRHRGHQPAFRLASKLSSESSSFAWKCLHSHSLLNMPCSFSVFPGSLSK